ncbi:MAG: hypothetical protein ABSH42_19415 [Bryobacteraceae bacterium]|jgi:hypothetical protein
MQEIWRILAEILVEPGDMASGSTKGFMNITTWADSTETARAKIAGYLGTFKWHVISIEDARPIDGDQDYGEEIEDMIGRTRSNPNAIILGTFHGYKEN